MLSSRDITSSRDMNRLIKMHMPFLYNNMHNRMFNMLISCQIDNWARIYNYIYYIYQRVQ